jgi:hypothetical protein
MNSRNVLLLLSVVFVLVLIWNVLYFTGIVGDFGTEPVQQQAPASQFDEVPGIPVRPGRAITTQRPRPAGAAPQSQVAAPRSEVSTTDLAIGDNWGRNPFLTPAEIWAIDNYEAVTMRTPAIPASGLRLTAVMADSGGRRMAVINDNVAGIGDTIAGMEILDITDDGVVFRVGDERHLLRMQDATIGLTVRGDGAAGQ